MPTFDEFFQQNYNTSLSPTNEARYQNWLSKMADLGRNVRNADADYDMRGYWLNGGWQDSESSGHFPDTYKKPNHPTFSDQSQYHNTTSPWGPNYQGGVWQQGDDGSWSFAPSTTMLTYTHNVQDLQNYFGRAEKGNRLILPDGSK